MNLESQGLHLSLLNPPLNASNHVLFFDFEEEEEAENIIASEPWTFDRNLVLLQCYNKKIPIQDLVFNRVSLWVQVYDILVGFFRRDVGEELCKVIGMVYKSTDFSKMEGGNFLRVRVNVDVSINSALLRSYYFF